MSLSKQLEVVKNGGSLSIQAAKVLAGLLIGLANTPPAAAFGVALVGIFQWNMEHIALERLPSGAIRFRRLSTSETSNLKDVNLTPFSAPIVSMAVRLADAGADTAEAALALAQTQINSVASKGLITTGLEFIFGGG